MCPQQSDAVRLSRVLGDHRPKKKKGKWKRKGLWLRKTTIARQQCGN